MSPKYRHDCERCEFLGTIEGCDLYFAGTNHHGYPTVIARFGDYSSEYVSGLNCAEIAFRSLAKQDRINKAFGIAYAIVKARGLI